MGRQQYLERLALGRSAFEDPHSDPKSQEQSTSHAAVVDIPSQGDGEGYQQQYDPKGRPINPSTEERNAELRNAQNAVYALVGVVESKDNADRSSEMKFQYIREAREDTLKAEHDRGEDLDIVLKILHTAICCWPGALIMRVQAGVYSPSMSFADIVLMQLRSGRHHGLGGFFATFLPGTPAMLASATLRLLSQAAVEEVENRLSTWLIRQRWLRRMTVNRIYRVLELATEVLYFAIDVALLPLDFLAAAQQLGLAPAWPLVPTRQSFLPSSPLSFHNFMWKSFLTVPLLRRICSPADLLIMQNMMKRDQETDDTHGNETQRKQAPVASQFTSFRYPVINAPSLSVDRPYVRQDPLGWILYNGYLVRRRALQWCGWNVSYIRVDPYSREYLENDHVPRSTLPTNHRDDHDPSDDDDDGLHHAHRSTALSHMPAQHIACYVDNFFTRLLMIPFESLVFRAVACSFLSSSLPKTTLALSARSHIYAPFGSGPLMRLFPVSSFGRNWPVALRYLSRLGLSLAFHSSTEIALFFVVYKLARWQGIRNFNWGQAITANVGQWNRVVYRMPGERLDPN